MSVKEIVDILTNPNVVAVIGVIVGYLFNNWKIAPAKKMTRALKAIDAYAPIIFQAVEEMAEMAKKRGDVSDAKIDKAMEYEKLMKKVITVYGGMWNDEVKAIAHATAKAIHESSK